MGNASGKWKLVFGKHSETGTTQVQHSRYTINWLVKKSAPNCNPPNTSGGTINSTPAALPSWLLLPQMRRR